ncbi:MAG: magnesium transporter MgtC [Devosia sp.]|uniref:MgtC/SapB family protein n=1 Tax=Devosia sp. TaxID=1871048 RepID=UPI002636ADF4|nr:MgtC/SapB family protein [Devosia sp.]MDB5538927.1 magnesium transporter MgtC [Devosia sp.]
MDFLTTIGFEPTHTPQHIILIRLLIAAILGAVIGWERGAEAGAAAGLRTHILIALAAALFTTLAFEIYHEALEGGSTNPDPIRAIEAVTAGIAFLGAGAIFQQRGSIQGLTTGAGMWLAGAVGVTAALGYYLTALAVAVFAVIVLAALRAFSHQVVSAGSGETGKGTEPRNDR